MNRRRRNRELAKWAQSLLVISLLYFGAVTSRYYQLRATGSPAVYRPSGIAVSSLAAWSLTALFVVITTSGFLLYRQLRNR